MKDVQDLKIAIIHDHLYEYGGAEKVLWGLLRIFPRADLYTFVKRDLKGQRAFNFELSKHKIFKSKLSIPKLPKLAYKLLIPLQVRYFEKLKLDEYDLVISSSSGFAKFINTKSKHIAYIHTPPRFLWGMETSFFHKIPRVFRFLLRFQLKKWKKKDYKYARKADIIITNSLNIQKKVKEFYKKDSKIVYPPCDLDEIINYPEQTKENFYLTIGRLYPYKKIDLIIKAFNQNRRFLIIIGDGLERKKYQEMAKSNIQILGFVDEKTKLELLKKSKGFVFATEEDFGIVMVEALAAGTPVIAYNKGGAKEIIKANTNGILFDKQNVDSLSLAIDKFEKKKFDREKIIKSSAKFSSQEFEDNFYKLIASIKVKD